MTAIMAAKWVADALNKVNMLYLLLIFNDILLLYTSFEQIIFDGSRREIWQTLARSNLLAVRELLGWPVVTPYRVQSYVAPVNPNHTGSYTHAVINIINLRAYPRSIYWKIDQLSQLYFIHPFP